MRVVSLVPSWTETLIEAGADVVGRTRFCIHPRTEVPAVGGTKSFDADLVRSLRPDLILLDREENTREMADLAASISRTHVTHITHVRDLAPAMEDLATTLSVDRLREFAARARAVLAKPITRSARQTEFVYCIWKDPWMAAGRDTFIASMLEREGYDLEKLWPRTKEKYPKFDFADIPPGAEILLSSEPYPFAKKPPQTSRPTRLVDGEVYSWFGIRAIRYLEGIAAAG